MTKAKVPKSPEIPTLSELINERATQGSQHRRSGPARKKNTRFPVVVDAPTREWLDAQALAFNTSLAGLAGMILMGVARREGTKKSASQAPA